MIKTITLDGTLTPLLYVPIAAVFYIVIAVAIRRLLSSRGYRYQARRYLMTRNENAFFSALQKAFNDHYFIYSKVRIADVLTPDYRNGTKIWWRAFVRISSKHVDYVLVDKRTRTITACIELDDPSHYLAQRKKRDAMVNAAFHSAQLPLLRVRTAKNYDILHLQSLLQTKRNK